AGVNLFNRLRELLGQRHRHVNCAMIGDRSAGENVIGVVPGEVGGGIAESFVEGQMRLQDGPGVGSAEYCFHISIDEGEGEAALKGGLVLAELVHYRVETMAGKSALGFGRRGNREGL